MRLPAALKRALPSRVPSSTTEACLPRLHLPPAGEDGVIDLTQYRTTALDRAAIRAECDARFGEAFFRENAAAVRLQAQYAGLTDIPDEDLVSLRHYTEHGARVMNEALRAPDAPARVAQKPSILGAASALNALPSWEGVSTRSLRASPARLEAYSPGTVVTERGFLSTSAHARPMSTFEGANPEAGLLIRVQSKGLGKCIDLFSHDPYEAEILYPPGSRFYVASNAFDEEAGRVVVDLQQV